MVVIVNKETKEEKEFGDEKLLPTECEIYYSEYYPVPDATLLVNNDYFKHWYIFIAEGNRVDDFEIKNA